MTYLAKEYNLDLDYKTSMSWKSNWGKRTSIGLDICPPGRIRLYYTVTKGNDEPREYRYFVHIESTDCNYGGQRWWFDALTAADDAESSICHLMKYTSPVESATI